MVMLDFVAIMSFFCELLYYYDQFNNFLDAFYVLKKKAKLFWGYKLFFHIQVVFCGNNIYIKFVVYLSKRHNIGYIF